MSLGETIKQNKATFIALGVIVILFIVAFSLIAVLQNSYSNETKAYVHDGDGNVTELALDKDSTTVIAASLGVNTVVVKDGQVRISDADCPNQDCVRQRAISHPGEQLICLPHKLWVTIGQNSESGMDTSAVLGEEEAQGSSEDSSSSSTSNSLGISDSSSATDVLDAIAR